MTVIRDIIETTLRNHGVEYTDAEVEEMIELASFPGILASSGARLIDRLETVISPYLGSD